MKRLIIHAGLPKTGTSALQVFLARNRDVLLRQSIDYLPRGDFDAAKAGHIASGNAAPLARAMLPADHPIRLDNLPAQLAGLQNATRASGCETGLISSEFFAQAAPARWQDFALWARQAGLAPRLIYFVRAQDQLLSSIYVQDVKRGWCQEPPESFVRNNYRDIPYLKHASFFATMAEIFGPENIIVRVYEELRDSPLGLCLGFLEAIGANIADPAAFSAPPEGVNTGLSGAEIAIMRELNKYSPQMKFSDLLVRNSHTARGNAAGAIHHILPPALVTEINAYFADENAAFARRHYGREELFANSGTADTPPESVDDISTREIVSVLGGLLVRYDERLTALEGRRGEPLSPWRWLWQRLRR